MLRTLAVVLVVSMVAISGCASSTPPPRPSGARVDSLQRVVIVGSGESKFTMLHERAEAANTFDGLVTEILKWIPASYGAILAPLAKIAASAINSGDEDVTHPERLPLQTFTRDADFTRHELREVLERAGQRIGNELLYARGSGR